VEPAWIQRGVDAGSVLGIERIVMLDRAERIAAEVAKAATARGLRVAISVVDVHGNPVLLHRMDGAAVHTLDLAFRKAYTAASFGVETATLMPRVQPGQPMYGLVAGSGGKLIAFGGGVPFELEEGVLVGVGVSGGTASQDAELVKEALAAL
jgi:uncharacterized protein GlcG (DUF336 family)